MPITQKEGEEDVIEISDLQGGYSDCQVLHDINLKLPEGCITTIIGPNGCGKSTLLKTIARYLPAFSGSICCNGKDIAQYSRKEFARIVSILPQWREVPSITVERLVLYGRFPHLSFARKITERDAEICRQAMMDTGTLNMREKDIRELSGGERQRVYLAMTLAQDSEYLLLDEPTTYLDIAQKYEIMELICRICATGKTIVMTLHDLPLAFAYSDRVAIMEGGRICCCGTPQAVLESGTVDRVFSVESHCVNVAGNMEYVFLPAYSKG